MLKLKMIKLDSAGAHLPDDAAQWDAVFLPDHGVTFTATPINEEATDQQALQAMASNLTLCGSSNWDLAEIDEAQLIIDRTRCNPAINTDYFRNIPSDWMWTKTAVVGSSASAWSVNFYDGYVSYDHRYSNGFALAVRRAGQ